MDTTIPSDTQFLGVNRTIPVQPLLPLEDADTLINYCRTFAIGPTAVFLSFALARRYRRNSSGNVRWRRWALVVQLTHFVERTFQVQVNDIAGLHPAQLAGNVELLTSAAQSVLRWSLEHPSYAKRRTPGPSPAPSKWRRVRFAVQATDHREIEAEWRRCGCRGASEYARSIIPFDELRAEIELHRPIIELEDRLADLGRFFGELVLANEDGSARAEVPAMVRQAAQMCEVARILLEQLAHEERSRL